LFEQGAFLTPFSSISERFFSGLLQFSHRTRFGTASLGQCIPLGLELFQKE
jgi:hypothetical protein